MAEDHDYAAEMLLQMSWVVDPRVEIYLWVRERRKGRWSWLKERRRASDLHI